jgi:hypothetical protein
MTLLPRAGRRRGWLRFLSFDSHSGRVAVKESREARSGSRGRRVLMRWLVISIAALAALVGATYALASGGSQGDHGSLPGFALVDPNGGFPAAYR